jgi:bifunctional non-homologous end joining protein LigD
MALTEYRRKRNFTVTTEPRDGRAVRHKSLTYVVQKHAASHLHYDFRLELDGVLKSWAVPKGPSLDPAHKRLAMHVEDHPLEYGDFEGIIPQGEYGGGTVLLWDRGTWEPVGDGKRGYREGSLKLVLHGEKLQGRWMLVRKGGKRSAPHEKNWFLFKEKDEFARPGSDIDAEEPLSVATSRDMDEIASAAERVWGPAGEVKKRSKSSATKKASARERKALAYAKPSANGRALMKKPRAKPRKLTAKDQATVTKTLRRIGKKRASIPTNLSVQLATLVSDAPEGDDWLHEIKFDGYRMLCTITAGKARFVSRNGKDWTAKFKNLAAEIAELPLKNAVIDGEVVIVDEEGRTSFQLMQNAFKSAAPAPFVFYAFDLLFLNGYDVTEAPLEERKRLLQRIIPKDETSTIRYSDHVVGKGPVFFAEASRLKLEGIISKRLGRPYVAGRGYDWLKVKCSLREEFVIGGFTKPSGSRKHFGALLLGYYDQGRNFIYAGRVGTGFDERTLSSLRLKFDKLIQDESPFKNLSGRTGQARDVTWLKPSLIAQVEFSNWTDERQLRHPSFQGLREDKAAKNVVRDDPISAKAIESTTKAAQKTKRKSGGLNVSVPRKGKEAKVNAGSKEIAGVTLSHPDKVLYPDDGFTKLDLARYYEQVAEWMLPQVENRLLSLVRCPAGSGQKCFFQKHPGQGTSDYLLRTAVPEKEKSEDYLSVKDLSGLIALVQMGVLEIHIWGSKADQFQKPDRLIIDLDPDPTVDWPRVILAAKEVKLLFEELGLESFIKTTGGKGLHVVVPIQRRTSWDDAKAFCLAVANFLVAAAPDRYIAKMSKAARKNKIFVDYLRNDQGSTAIAPYSTRNRPGATVSVPITWNELKDGLTSDYFNIENLPKRLAKLNKDPWAGIDSVKQSITAAMLKKLQFRKSEG